jgi:uncharacterized protein
MESPFHPRISLVTLGVDDLARARAFYEALGLVPAAASQGDVVFYQLNGMALALFPRPLLAEDAGVPADGSGFKGITLAQNHVSPEAVDAAMARAVDAGGRLVRPAEPVYWGGYRGYVADPDGHLWEFAHNPFFPLDAAGNMSLE